MCETYRFEPISVLTAAIGLQQTSSVFRRWEEEVGEVRQECIRQAKGYIASVMCSDPILWIEETPQDLKRWLTPEKPVEYPTFDLSQVAVEILDVNYFELENKLCIFVQTLARLEEDDDNTVSKEDLKALYGFFEKLAERFSSLGRTRSRVRRRGF